MDAAQAQSMTRAAGLLDEARLAIRSLLRALPPDFARREQVVVASNFADYAAGQLLEANPIDEPDRLVTVPPGT